MKRLKDIIRTYIVGYVKETFTDDVIIGICKKEISSMIVASGLRKETQSKVEDYVSKLFSEKDIENIIRMNVARTIKDIISNKKTFKELSEMQSSETPASIYPLSN